MSEEQENKWREAANKESIEFNAEMLSLSKRIIGWKKLTHEDFYIEGYLEARKKAQKEIIQLKEELKNERFFSSKFELQTMRGFPASKEWYYLVKEHLKAQKQRKVKL